MSSPLKNPLAVNSNAFFFEQDRSDKILVLGVGNYLMGDEGVGVHATEALAERGYPDHMELLDGGTGGFLLLSAFEAYSKIIIIDATIDGQPAGTINQIEPKFASDFPSALSVHDLGLKDMIEAVYLMDQVPRMFLFTVAVEELVPMCIDLSPKVSAALPRLTEQILTLAETLQKEAV